SAAPTFAVFFADLTSGQPPAQMPAATAPALACTCASSARCLPRADGGRVVWSADGAPGDRGVCLFDVAPRRTPGFVADAANSDSDPDIRGGDVVFRRSIDRVMKKTIATGSLVCVTGPSSCTRNAAGAKFTPSVEPPFVVWTEGVPARIFIMDANN